MNIYERKGKRVMISLNMTRRLYHYISTIINRMKVLLNGLPKNIWTDSVSKIFVHPNIGKKCL